MKRFFLLVIISITVVKPAPSSNNIHLLLSQEKQNKNFTKVIINQSVSYEKLQVDTRKKLELLHIVFRHGERTPADTYPNDPFINFTFQPYGWGQITNDGKWKLYKTGKWLGDRYKNFLGPYYFPELVHAQATGVSRTQVSLETVLAGLFPPRNTPMEWNKELNWQPIPFISQPLDEDNLLLVRINCPRYYEALEEVMQLPEIRNSLQKSKDLLHNLTEITGLNIKTAEDVSSLWSTLSAEEVYGLELPKWTKDYYPKKMQELTDLSYIWNIYTPEMKRIKGGPFLTKMYNEWEDKKDGKLLPETRKLFIYTGHDSTIVNILAALDVWKLQNPGYSVMAIFELYKDTTTNSYYVKIYQRNESEDPIPLILPGCTEMCPLENVLKHMEPFIITSDLTKECTAHKSSYTTPIPSGP